MWPDRDDPREVGAVREWIQHPEDGDCNGGHCSACNVDEPVGERPYYLVCAECNHLFRTKRDLRREHRRVLLQIIKDPVLFWWYRFAPIRVSQIYTCPMCSHDL